MEQSRFLNDFETKKEKLIDIGFKFIDETIKKLNLDINLNKELCDKYYSNLNQEKKLTKSIKRLKVWRWILIIFLIFPYFLMTNSMKAKQEKLKISSAKTSKLKKELIDQINPFLAYLSKENSLSQVKQVWEEVKFSTSLSNNDFAPWHKTYEHFSKNENMVNTLFTGWIKKHPFLLTKIVYQTWYQEKYTGTLPVSYTYVDSDGKMRTGMTTAIAVVMWPAPKWGPANILFYKTNAAPKLCFENETALKKEKNAKKFYKANNKLSPMDNPEFDVAFPCMRNDEKDFRVLFTILAQEDIVNLVRNSKYQYMLEKTEEINSVFLGVNPKADKKTEFEDQSLILGYENSDSFRLSDLTNCYVDNLTNFFSILYNLYIPLKAIPAYDMEDYSETDKVKSNGLLGSIQNEANAQHIFDVLDWHSHFKTKVTIKTKEILHESTSGFNFNLVELTCHSFNPIPKIIPTPTYCAVANKTVIVPVTVIDYKLITDIINIVQVVWKDGKRLQQCKPDHPIIAGFTVHDDTDIFILKSEKKIDSALCKSIFKEIYSK